MQYHKKSVADQSSQRNLTTDTSRGKPGQWVTLVLIGSLLTGCDSISTRFVTGLSAEERALAAEFPVYREKLAEGSYELVGPVKGLSCQTGVEDTTRVSEENAIIELQRATFQAGGNAVMEVRCEAFGRRQGTRSCFRSIECQGQAVLITPTD